MKSLLALLLASACFQAQSANLPPCDKAVRFSAAWFADPEVDNTKPAAELTKIGAGAGRSGTQLGHVVVETKLAVMPQTSCQGVFVRLDYIKPVLRVASEIPPGSCAYAHVMKHEQTHVRIHRDIARQFRELDYPWASGGSSAGILVYAKQELDRLEPGFGSGGEAVEERQLVPEHGEVGGKTGHVGFLVIPAGLQPPDPHDLLGAGTRCLQIR